MIIPELWQIKTPFFGIIILSREKNRKIGCKLGEERQEKRDNPPRSEGGEGEGNRGSHD